MRKPTTQVINSPAAQKTVLGRRPSLRGFILVIIPIIGILASLLLPALSLSGRFGGPKIGIPNYAARTMIGGADSRIKVLGTLTLRDLAEIRHIVRREKWRGVLPNLPWSFIRGLPGAIRSRLSARISGITAKAEGTVMVQVVVQGWDVLAGQWKYWLDHTYTLKKGQKGWQIIEVSYYDHCYG